ncbi:piggyBac transposable element-derived protein 3-like [Gordionus sp. m RMFG-2023]|uniref:piggyBac transposable element-derived protein 3-like n=1 Tax=Gordionus sp. m RMFG-2023 TaxID=3053472 RepID=UPI0031FD94FA
MAFKATDISQELRPITNCDNIPNDSEDSNLSETSDFEFLSTQNNDLDFNETDESEEENINNEKEIVRRKMVWKICLTNLPLIIPKWKGEIPTVDKVKKPMDYFNIYLNELIPLIVYESNLYVIQSRLYWATNTRQAKVADVMTLNRWEQIKSFIHINDNDKFIPLGSEGHDPLHKIRPLITLTNNILKSLSIGENICVDEQIIPYKGMSRLKQYNPQKPQKWGYKAFLLCGDDGLLHNFEVYSGKILPAEGLPDVGASGNAVLRLFSYIPQQINYKLFFDNWLCSPNLLVVLAQRGIFFVATVRGNRLPNINFPTDKELKKRRGFFV